MGKPLFLVFLIPWVLFIEFQYIHRSEEHDKMVCRSQFYAVDLQNPPGSWYVKCSKYNIRHLTRNMLGWLIPHRQIKDGVHTLEVIGTLLSIAIWFWDGIYLISLSSACTSCFLINILAFTISPTQFNSIYMYGLLLLLAFILCF